MFSVDGTRIISGDGNGNFRTWDAVAGVAIVMIPSKRHRTGTLAVAFASSCQGWLDISPDGKWIARICASACRDDHKYGVEIWNSATGELATTIESSSVTPYFLTRQRSGLLTLLIRTIISISKLSMSLHDCYQISHLSTCTLPTSWMCPTWYSAADLSHVRF